MILDEIVDKKKILLQKQKQSVSVDSLIKMVENGPCKDFYTALNKERIAIIAEVKKASPSKGIIKQEFDHVKIAIEYTKGGANAISVLTEQDFFLGNELYLIDIKKVTSLPVLRKDFIIDEYQIYQSKAMGADAILLIAAILDDNKLKAFHTLAKQLKIHTLVETHTQEEVERVGQIGAEIIGINNRNLKTFDVDIHTTEKLLKFIPKGTLSVSESGIKTHDDLAYLEQLGVNAVLIGETLMLSENIGAELEKLRGKA